VETEGMTDPKPITPDEARKLADNHARRCGMNDMSDALRSLADQEEKAKGLVEALEQIEYGLFKPETPVEKAVQQRAHDALARYKAEGKEKNDGRQGRLPDGR
jgi:hypothetical protein